MARVAMPQLQDQERPMLGPLVVWGWGMALPLFLSLYAIVCILRQEGMLPTQTDTVMLYGSNAVALGIGLLAIAGLLHLQCFWDTRHGSTCAGARGKMLCLLLLASSVYYLCIHMLAHMG